MLNLARYIGGCFAPHHFCSRHRKSAGPVLLSVAVLSILIWALARSSPPLPQFGLPNKGDTVSTLQAQIGYLKQRYLQDVGRVVNVDDGSGVPTIYIVTPTHQREVQKAELTRLCHTLLLVPNVHWIIVEDGEATTDLVTNFLSRECGVPFTHLFALTPPEQKLKPKDKRWSKPRGVMQRNEALRWLRQHGEESEGSVDGVLYFADDDNTYSTKLFEEMRFTKRVSVWPVAFVGNVMVERPKVALDPRGSGTAKVIGWNVAWSKKRPFAIDMSGFAVNYNLLLRKPDAKFSAKVRHGYQETEFLGQLVTLDDLEPKADLCTKVYTWHTRTEKPLVWIDENRIKLLVPPSNADIEV